jgi:amino acid transporter
MPGGPPATTPTLARAVGRWDLAALAINGLIGSAIFGLPAAAARLTGAWSPVATVLCAAVVILIVLCFAEAASLFVGTGGPYLYAREAFGERTGLAAGWMMWLARATAFAANSNLLVSYLGFFVPAMNGATPRVGTITIVTAVLVWVNVRGVRQGATVGDVLAAVKLVPMLGFVALGLGAIDRTLLDYSTVPPSSAVGSAMLLYVFAFTGFEYAAIPAGEATAPKRDLPFAMLVSIGVAAVLYTGIQTVCVATLPELTTSRTAMADAAARFLGPVGGAVVALAAVASILGNLSGMALVSPRLTYALSEDGLLPRPLARVHGRFRTPFVSILTYGVFALALALSGTFEGMVRISAVARIVPFSLTCLAVPVLRRRYPQEPDRFRLPGGATIPALAVLLCLWLLTQSPRGDLMAAAAALGTGYLLMLATRLLPSSMH